MTLSLLSLVGAAPAVCAGCPVAAEVNQEVVNFAVSELQGGDDGKCLRDVIKVENFQSQVCFNKYLRTTMFTNGRWWPGLCSSLTWC